jgi:hypothetical protein
VPRPLLARERAALNTLLAADFPGAIELRVQARTASADGNGLIIELRVDPSLPTATVSSRVPVEAVVDGADHNGGLILIVEDGRLAALEYWWVTDEKPAEFPPADAIGRPKVDR